MKKFILGAATAVIVLVANQKAAAQDAQDPANKSIIAGVIENDMFDNQDRGYTSGLRLGYSPPTDKTPDWVHSFADKSPIFVDGDTYRVAFTLGQNMFTPRDITLPNPPLDDRPYAGWLYATAGIVGGTPDRLDSLELSIGVVGPASLAEQSQKLVHDIIGSEEPLGWDNQLHNEPAFLLTYQRRWKTYRNQFGAFDVDFAPHAGAAVGNVFTYANAGATIRFGQNLGNDFGPPRVQPSVPGTGLTGSDGFSWYGYVSTDIRGVAHNIFLDGNTFRDSPSVNKETFVADAQIGVVFSFDDVTLGYTHVFRTDEFETQRDQTGFGAISISVAY